MSSQQIIEAIKELPPEQRADVVRFTQQYEAVPQLSPEELGALADRLATATDPAEIAGLEKAIVNGFYGAKIDA